MFPCVYIISKEPTLQGQSLSLLLFLPTSHIVLSSHNTCRTPLIKRWTDDISDTTGAGVIGIYDFGAAQVISLSFKTCWTPVYSPEMGKKSKLYHRVKNTSPPGLLQLNLFQGLEQSDSHLVKCQEILRSSGSEAAYLTFWNEPAVSTLIASPAHAVLKTAAESLKQVANTSLAYRCVHVYSQPLPFFFF